MRPIVLDTYYGEGPLDTSDPKWPGWKHIYFKVCEGAYGYLDAGNTLIREVTNQIAEEAREFDTTGIYHYPRRNDYVNWKLQADAYLRQCDYLDKRGIVVDYDVLDVEAKNIVNPDGTYPSQAGAWFFEIFQYVTERTRRPYFLYSTPYTRRDCFYRYGYKWIDEIPWICAQYPYGNSNPIETVMQRWDEAVAGTRDPYLFPVNYKPVMWQVTDRFPTGNWMPQAKACDVNVWLVDWRELLKKEPVVEPPTSEKKAIDHLKEAAASIQAAIELMEG